jgi:hypothetical protein
MGGGIANLVRRGTDHNAVLVSVLQHLEATAIHLVFGNQTSETRGGQLLAHTTLDRVGPIRVSKQRIPRFTGWRSQCETYGLEFWLTTARGSVLHDYAIRNT